MNKRAGTGGRRGARGRAPRTGRPARPGQRRAHLRMAVRAGPGAAAGGESQLAGAGARRAWWGFRHVSDVGTTWGPRPAHATAHSGVEAPAEKPAEAGGGTRPPAPLRPAPGRPPSLRPVPGRRVGAVRAGGAGAVRAESRPGGAALVPESCGGFDVRRVPAPPLCSSHGRGGSWGSSVWAAVRLV